MTLSRATLTATTLLLLLLTGRGGAQDRGSAATRQQMMMITLDAIRRDDWRASEPIVQWGLLEAFTTELERNPGSPMAALVRLAGIRIDVTPRPIIARRADEVNIGIEQEPRLDLGRDIPYYADIYASIDGGQWFALNRVYDGKLCGSGSPRPQLAILEPGIHRLQSIVDINYLREAAEDDICTETGPASNVESVLPLEPDKVIQRERRELFARSFGIFPVLPTDVMISSIEMGLPDVPLSAWLHEEVARIGVDGEYWRTDFCNLQEASVFALVNWKAAPGLGRRQARPICLTYSAMRPDRSSLALRLRVATVNEETGEWTFEQPSFHDLSIGGDGNVLDVPYLSLLPQVLQEPTSGFPELDLAISDRDVRYEPVNAQPGEPIKVVVVVRNAGQRDAPLTTGLVILDSEGRNLKWHEFVADIPAQGKVEVSFSGTMPAAGAIAASVSDSVSLLREAAVPYSQLRDIDPDNNHAVRVIGGRRVDPQRPSF